VKPTAPEVRTHRLFGILAVLHAALLFFVLFPTVDWSDWMVRFWVALATLWFAWPLILALHSAQCAKRVLIPLAIAAPFVFFWFRWYTDLYAPRAFGLTEFVEFRLSSMFRFATSFGATPGTPRFSVETLKQCGIPIKYVASDVVSSEILAHARGYNIAMMPEIRRRWPAVVKATEDEDAGLEKLLSDGEKNGRAEAETDFRSGHFGIVLDDPSRIDDAAFEKWLRDNYQINVKRVNPPTDPKMENYVSGYASGYNRVSDAEIRHRFGKAALDEIWQKWVEIPQTTPAPH
jgi:hypothetical protein